VSSVPPLTGPQIAALLAGETTLFGAERSVRGRVQEAHFMNFCVKASGDGAWTMRIRWRRAERNETDDAI